MPLVWENLLLGQLRLPGSFVAWGILSGPPAAPMSVEQVRRFGIRLASLQDPNGLLSAATGKKSFWARELDRRRACWWLASSFGGWTSAAKGDGV